MITGYFAAYDGVEYQCALVHAADGARVLLLSGAPVEGFTAVDGRYQLEVDARRCDAVGLRRETATYRRHAVYVVDQDDAGVLVEYDGPNDPAEQGARLVERGVWQQRVSATELRNRAFTSTLLAL